jgi:hypothetical protein
MTSWFSRGPDRGPLPVGVDLAPSDAVWRARELEALDARLSTEASRPDILRDHALIDDLLDRWLVLAAPAGSMTLRPAVPVIPGRS